MENKEKTLQEQEAPLKNTDHAFVQVGHDGEPVVPKTDAKSSEQPAPDEQTAPGKS